MKHLLAFFALVILGACTNNSENNVLKFDGVYQSDLEEVSNPQHSYYSYLRFYDEGNVISVSTSGTPDQIQVWFNMESDKLFERGQYTFENNRIKFSTKSEFDDLLAPKTNPSGAPNPKGGAVNYEGEIKSDKLILTITSEINGNIETRKYRYIPD